MMREKRQRKDWSVLAVQTVVGGILLLLILVLQMLGGDVYDGLRGWFQTTLSEDVLKTEPNGQGGEFVPPDSASVIAPKNATAIRLLVEEPYPLLYGGKLTSDYGYRTDPLRGDTAFHTGVDIAAPRGTPLYAVCNATVLKTGVDRSYGNYVVLSVTDNIEVLYAHCDTVRGAVGQTVKAGETVATVGSTGDSTGPHVHFMVKCDGVAYDPSAWINANCYA